MSTRTDLEKEIYYIHDVMDPSGKNTRRIRDFFHQMDDKTFYRHMDEFFSNPDKLFPIAYEAYNNPVDLDFIHKVAKTLDVPIYERVYRPYVNGDTEDPPGTVNKIMVLECPVKRLKQMAQSKNHASTAAAKRDPKNGQVTGEDRTARVTDVECYSLLAEGQYNAAQEFYGPMADDSKAHYEMLRRIQRDGEVELKDLPNDTINKVTLNTINYYMWGSGIETNLVDETGALLPMTIMAREEQETTIKR